MRLENAARVALSLVAGALVGAFGTAIHRSIFGGVPVGLMIALALTVSAGLFVRAAAGFPAFAAYGLAWIMAVFLLSLVTHGNGDILIPDPMSPVVRATVPWWIAGVIWPLLGSIFLVLMALLPLRWFQPRTRAVTTLDNLEPKA